ncbi:hypothetical protein MNBD_DELTA02-652 [hydrothermal vent metagenome]|uniref:Nitrogen regulatory protein P-II n=1 Tax=hydrothermal vent metagenome TaxID=652676 RepID=A0A3B0UZR3_9ZZZZ
MKEIKAYMREFKAEEVINGLEEAGVPGVTVIKMQGTGKNISETARYSIDYCEKVAAIAKIEVVCADEDVVKLVDIIQKTAYTGHKGDGMIFISNVEHAIKIKTGEWGEGALLPTLD